MEEKILDLDSRYQVIRSRRHWHVLEQIHQEQKWNDWNNWELFESIREERKEAEKALEVYYEKKAEMNPNLEEQKEIPSA